MTIPKKLLLLLTNLVWLNVVDVITTWAGLSLGAIETNPYQNSLNITGITLSAILVKLGYVFLLIVLLLFIYFLSQREIQKKTPRKITKLFLLTFPYVFAIALNVFYFWVVCNNIIMLNGQIQEVWKYLPK